jgi:hypothetical protein
MSIFNRIATIGEQAMLAAGHADTLTVTTGDQRGQRITGRLDIVEVIDPDMPLGADTRMQVVFRVIPPVVAIQINDILADGESRWKVIKRENNVVSVTQDFWLEQQI